MHRVFRKIISCFLLVAFLFAITPKEIIHAVSGHHDTQDCNANGFLSIGKSHLHCLVLQLQVNPFHKNPEPEIPANLVHTGACVFQMPESHSFSAVFVRSMRGPPCLS